MSKKPVTIHIHIDLFEHARQSVRDDYVDGIREGRRQRASTFRAKKGKGSYRRKTKHKEV